MSNVQIGSEIGGYRLELLVGSGSFGSVWRARHIASNRVVALKVLTGTYSTGEVATSRAAIELLAASASAASPHVVKVLDGGVEPVPYVVMEYIEGRNLRARIDAEGPLGVEETLRIGHAVADALRVLNDARIIHRDVKPANVMITAQGVPKLTDFGIAKIVGYESVTLTGVPMSPAYTAPEAWEENRASHYSDLYALGILMYECLTGRPPFVGTYPQVYQAHLSREPDYDALPEKLPSLLELLRKCLAKDPADRPADAGVCLVLIEQAQAEWRERYGAEVPPAGPEPRAFGPWLRQSPHPSLPDAWLCIHEQTAQGATVEVVSTDDVALGQALRRAMEANATLVPLGAERLLGTNRLVLRPGEAWATPPAGQFQFWVAREDAVVEQGSRPLAPDALRQVATKVLVLEAAAEAVGLSLETGRLVLDDRAALCWSRPGLPPDDEAVLTALDWLRQLPLDADAMEAAASAGTVTELIDAPRANSAIAAETVLDPLPLLESGLAPGEAHLQEAQEAVEDGVATVQSLRIGDFGQLDEPLQPPDDGPDETQADEESVQPWPDAGTTRSRGGSRRNRLALAIPIAAVMAVAAAAAFFLIREGNGEATNWGAAAETATATPSPNSTVAPSVTATVPTTPTPVFAMFPDRTNSVQQDSCGRYTVMREASAGQFSDAITLMRPDGSVAREWKPISTAGIPARTQVIRWCFDVTGDGNPELLMAFNTGGTTVPDTALYSLGESVKELFNLKRLGWDFVPQDLDGKPPSELVGTDTRFKGFSSAGAFSQYPLAVVRVDSSGPHLVSREFPDLLRTDRDAHLQKFLACLSALGCSSAEATPLMVDSIQIGDWDSLKSDARLSETVIAAIASCRGLVEFALSDLGKGDIGSCDAAFRVSQQTPTPLPTSTAIPPTATSVPKSTPTPKPSLPPSQTPTTQSASLLRIGPVTGGSGIVNVVIYNSDRSSSVGPIEITVAITRSGVTYSQTGTLTFDPFTGDPRDNGHNFQIARPPGAGEGTINVIYQGTVVTSAQDVLP